MTTQLLHTVVPVAWKSTGTTGELEGYASTFGNVDLGGDVVEAGAFAETVADISAGRTIPLLADHESSTRSVVGTITWAAEDSRGLKIRAHWAPDDASQVIRQKAAAGHLTGLSIGYQLTGYRYEQRQGTEVRVLSGVKLFEVSVVVFPMNPEATITSVKSARAHHDPLLDRLDAAELRALLT